MWSHLGLLALAALGCAPARAQNANITPYMPIVVPLAVRSPYLGAYLTGRQDKNLATMSPRFWAQSPLGWTGLIRVDGAISSWMGNLTEWPAASNASFAHTASTTTFTFEAGPVEQRAVSLKAEFFSPVTPSDLLRQSIPFSYLSLTAESLDGSPHQVEVYTEVNGLWAADREEEVLEWSQETDGASDSNQAGTWKGARFRLRDQRPWQEESDRILCGDVFYAARTEAESTVSTTLSAGADAVAVRHLFASSGSLGDLVDKEPRAIRRRNASGGIADEPVFALAHNFGLVGPESAVASRSALLAIGHVRDPVVRYMTASNSTRQPEIIEIRPLWASRFSTPQDMLGWFLQDYGTVRQMAIRWEEKLEQDARRVHSQEYANVVQVSTRQIFMALEPVWDQSPLSASRPDLSRLASNGAPAMVMLKEISSNGNCQTVDVITPFLPFLVYAEPNLIPLLLEPILRYTKTGLYEPIPPVHDIGDRYPNATGRNDFKNPNLPLEESGNMMAMIYAALRLGAGQAQAKEYWDVISQWATWMQGETLYPGLQRSTDDFFGAEANQTSLAIKGLVGLAAMAQTSEVLGHHDEHFRYQNLSVELTEKFLSIAVSKDQTHLLGTYNKQDSWVTQYNLYLDKLLGTNLFPPSITAMQDIFYMTKARPFGPPLDSRRPDRAKTDFLMWTAGASNSTQTRDMFVNAVASYFRHDANAIFGDLITPEDGWSVGFLSRPVAGGHYALLALDAMRQSAGASSQDLWRQLEDLSHRLAAAAAQLREHPSALGLTALVVGLAAFVLLWRNVRHRRGRRGSWRPSRAGYDPVAEPLGGMPRSPGGYADDVQGTGAYELKRTASAASEADDQRTVRRRSLQASTAAAASARGEAGAVAEDARPLLR